MDWRGRSGAGAGQEGASSVREEGGPSGVGACEEEVLAWASAERLVPWGLGPPESLLWASCLASARRASFLRPRPPGVNVTDTFPCPRDKAPSFPHPAPPPPSSPWRSWASCLHCSHICKEQNPAPSMGEPHSCSIVKPDGRAQGRGYRRGRQVPGPSRPGTGKRPGAQDTPTAPGSGQGCMQPWRDARSGPVPPLPERLPKWEQ